MTEKTTPLKASFAVRAFCRFFACFGIGIFYVTASAAAVEDDSAYDRHETRRSKKSSYLVRILALSAFATYVAGSSFALYDYVDDKPSLLDFVRLSYNIMAYTTILSGLVVMGVYDAELSQILFRSEFFVTKFHPRYFVNALLFNTPSLTIDLYHAVDAFRKERSTLIIAGYLCGIYVWQGQTATFCMYLQCEAVIRTQLKQLGDLVRSSSFNEESITRIARAKHCIRHTIERVNSIFGNVLLVYYLKLFTLVTLRIGAIILWGTERYLTLWLNTCFIISASMQILQIFETTRLGSDIIIESQQLGRFLYQPRRTWDDARRKNLTEIRRVLEYREHFDALLISDSFVNRKATIFTFLGTMFTCVAIILQFDCDVLKTLELAKSDSQ